MEKIKELVGLAQLLSAAMDDTENGVFNFSISSVDEGGHFLVRPDFFLENFKGFQIEKIENGASKRKFLLRKVIQGVTFATYVNDLSGMRTIRFMQRKGVSFKRHKKAYTHGNASKRFKKYV